MAPISENDFVSAYLARIGLGEAPRVDAGGLASLQCAHLDAIPFENLDVLSGRLPLSLDIDALYDKIIVRRRGGICYEINVLFKQLLEYLGFQVALYGGSHPKYGDEFDHAFIICECRGRRYLVDAGFADNPLTPIAISEAWQSDGTHEYRIIEREGRYLLQRRIGEGEQLLFSFLDEKREPKDYRRRLEWYCTAADSRFTQGALVTRPTPEGGRITLSSRHFITTSATERIEHEIDEDDFARILACEFGIENY